MYEEAQSVDVVVVVVVVDVGRYKRMFAQKCARVTKQANKEEANKQATRRRYLCETLVSTGLGIRRHSPCRVGDYRRP